MVKAMNNFSFTIYRKIGLLLFIVPCLLFTHGNSVIAQETQLTEYQLLAPIPLGPSGETEKTTATEFIPGLFRLVIMLATGLAVLMIIWGGIQYMSTDAWSEKNDAKGTIWNAIMGLFLALGSWLIINTINPGLLNFNLNIERFDIPPNTNLTAEEAPAATPVAGSCAGCGLITVPHKPAPAGCKAPGPCTIQMDLNAKLVALHKLQKLLVTESYPPTVTHRNTCHLNGSCVDATIAAANEANIKKFIENASSVGLDAQFETTTEKRASDIRKATGLSSQQVYFVSGINGEHFSIYNK
jgi:hypothetical protein